MAAGLPATAGESAAFQGRSSDLVLGALLVSFGALYARGAWLLWTRKDLVRVLRAWHAWAFIAGWLTAAAALLPPLAPLALQRFAGQMAQHELLMLVAAPLMALGRPRVPILWALPLAARQQLTTWLRGARGGWRVVTHPLVPVFAHGAAIWLWHLPPVFDAALRSGGLRALQQLTLFGTAFAFFAALVSRRMSPGLAVVSVFATVLHTSILGALFTFSDAAWYRFPSGAGFDALLDQRLAGILMWIPAGLLLGAVGLALLATWLERGDRRPSSSNVERLQPRHRPNTRTPA